MSNMKKIGRCCVCKRWFEWEKLTKVESLMHTVSALYSSPLSHTEVICARCNAAVSTYEGVSGEDDKS